MRPECGIAIRRTAPHPTFAFGNTFSFNPLSCAKKISSFARDNGDSARQTMLAQHDSKKPMFDHELIEKHPFEAIPLNRDLYLMDEKWMPDYEKALLTLFGGGEYNAVGYIAYAAARAKTADLIDLSWFPIINDRFHEIKVTLPRRQFVTCTECWQYDEKPTIFVRSDWLTNLYTRTYSVFALIDAIGVKQALVNGTLSSAKLVALRNRVDEIAACYSTFAFISFADSLLIKSNWSVGYFERGIKCTYDPEAIIRLLPELNTAYRDILAMDTYAIIAQGNNEYYDDSLLHISSGQNHISLNSLGLPFAQVMAIEHAVRKAVHKGIHPCAEVYMDEDFSLRYVLTSTSTRMPKKSMITPHQ